MAFATVDDVARRLGRASLSESETLMAEALLDAATAVITEAAGKDDAWVEALDPVPKILKVVCVELVVRVMENPGQAARFQEQLGEYSHSQSFRAAAEGGGLLLTDPERELVRIAAGSPIYGSAKVPSIIADCCGDDCGCDCEGS